MIKTLATLAIFLFPMTLLACPACAGGDAGQKATGIPNTVIILGCFIVATYVPFYLLFRAAKKFEPKNTNENL